jgi:hypothetical protein
VSTVVPVRDADNIEGACHCGTVRFRVRLSDGLQSARRCTCSYCAMRGAVAVSAAADDLEVVAGQDSLAAYRFNTGVAVHHFCMRCGIYTHHVRRSIPDQLGINVACLGVSPFDFAAVTVLDGQNHPSDPGNTHRVAGVLRFEAAPAPAERDG